LRAYGERRGVQVVATFGGAPIRTQMAQLKQGAQVVVGTPGRIMDLISRHVLFLSDARYVVLDEADEMLDLGFIEDIEFILGRSPTGRQTALFSATMPPPIRGLADQFMYEPEVIKVKAPTLTIDTVEQFYTVVDEREKADVLARIVREEKPDQAIIFVRTKIGADRLARNLGDRGVRVKALHGDMSQGQRDGVMLAFKGERERLLVATDVAARGLDISGVTHVINYDPPNSPDIYVHRIGRTGRVGRSGRAITLVTPKQRRDIDAIERHAKTEMTEWGKEPKAKPKSGNGEAAEPERETRRPRHTKPRDGTGPRVKLIIGAGRAAGVEPKDLVEAIVDQTHLENEDIRNVRVLDRFSLVEVPKARAEEVAKNLKWKAEVASK
jgi:ATP-dependent RNA helicase DeaD